MLLLLVNVVLAFACLNFSISIITERERAQFFAISPPTAYFQPAFDDELFHQFAMAFRAPELTQFVELFAALVKHYAAAL